MKIPLGIRIIKPIDNRPQHYLHLTASLRQAITHQALTHLCNLERQSKCLNQLSLRITQQDVENRGANKAIAIQPHPSNQPMTTVTHNKIKNTTYDIEAFVNSVNA